MATRKPSNWGFNVRDLDTRVRPQDDFYKYASGGWLKRNPIPKTESRWGSFMVVRKIGDIRLHTIIKGLMRTRDSKGPKQQIRDFYRSGMDMARRRRLGIKPLQPYLDRIAAIKDVPHMIETIARLEREGAGSGFWGLMVDQDMKNSERYMLHIYQSGIGMPDRDYYTGKDPEHTRVRNAYVKHLERLFAFMGQKADAKKHAATLMRIETDFAKVSMKKEDTRDVDKTYHKLTLRRLERLAPRINWRRYFTLLGAGVVRDVIVMQPKFLRSVERFLYVRPIEEWKLYLSFHLVRDMGSSLTPAFEDEMFSFYGTTLSGTKHKRPLWRRILNVTNGSLGELLGQEYVSRYFPRSSKRKVQAIVDDLFAAYADRIRHLDWMSAATKRKALVKLRMVTRKLGYPDKWRSYRGLRIRPDDYVGNLIRTSAFETRRQLRKLKKKVDRAEWFMSPQTVNAYYSGSLNDIVFPAGILQAPYFDPASDDALNYGSIGSVIGHEITHGFDDQGSKFDGKGNRRTWWRAADRKKFDYRAQMLVTQFNRYRVAGNVPVNGKLTLGENIADLGGISIAHDAYMRRLKKTGRANIQGFTPEQRFFLGVGLFDREHSRPEIEKTHTLTDPHSPPIFRVNGPFSNLPEFYAAFGVKKGDKLYRESSRRAKIW